MLGVGNYSLGSTVWGCVQRPACALTFSPFAHPPPPPHFTSTTTIIVTGYFCTCTHVHLRRLCKQTSRYRREIVFCFPVDYTNSPFPHYCEQRYHLWAWVDNKIENTEICMKLFSWTQSSFIWCAQWNRIWEGLVWNNIIKLFENSNFNWYFFYFQVQKKENFQGQAVERVTSLQDQAHQCMYMYMY